MVTPPRPHPKLFIPGNPHKSKPKRHGGGCTLATPKTRNKRRDALALALAVALALTPARALTLALALELAMAMAPAMALAMTQALALALASRQAPKILTNQVLTTGPDTQVPRDEFPSKSLIRH